MLMEMISQKSARITFDKRLYITSFGIVALALMLVIISGYMREQFIPDKKKSHLSQQLLKMLIKCT